MDVDRDGWIDMIVVPFPGSNIAWYRNPAGDQNAHWARHEIGTHANVETPVLADLFNDGTRQLVMGIGSDSEPQKPTLAWLEPGANPYGPWVAHAISVPGAAIAQPFAHGLGSMC
jgi:hypothetical protein